MDVGLVALLSGVLGLLCMGAGFYLGWAVGRWSGFELGWFAGRLPFFPDWPDRKR